MDVDCSRSFAHIYGYHPVFISSTAELYPSNPLTGTGIELTIHMSPNTRNSALKSPSKLFLLLPRFLSNNKRGRREEIFLNFRRNVG